MNQQLRDRYVQELISTRAQIYLLQRREREIEGALMALQEADQVAQAQPRAPEGA